jgi:hypothetical protein
VTDSGSGPREPQHLERSASESLRVSDEATRTVNAARTAEDALHMTDTVEARVAQAQALIATARGEAKDARVEVENFAASATTPAERDTANALLDILARIESRFDGEESLLRDILKAGVDSTRSATRWSIAQIALTIATFIAGLLIGYLFR